MSRWFFVALLVLQAHFAASYLVPLDETARGAFAGLLRWVWPWEIGDSGVLGQMTTSGFPLAGFFVAVTATGALLLAVLAVVGLWVPFAWWRALVVTGSVLVVVLMVSFFGPTKLLPIAVALFVLWITVTNRVSTTWPEAAGN